MESAKLKQYILSILAGLSLFASSVSACACSHHQEKSETEISSCHEHSTETKAAKNHAEEFSETIQTVVSESECVCFQIAPKIVAKSENIKVEKQVAAIPAIKPIEIIFVRQNISAQIDFAKPPYLSDSFYNLSPGRAPPFL